MDEMKVKLTDAVAAKLAAAPASADKDELIEELSDNLYRRFLDMTGAGVPEEEAFTRSLDDLGDVDELLSYLGVEPAGSAPDWIIDKAGTQTRVTSKDGHTIVINNPDNEDIVINTYGDDEAGKAADAADPAQAEEPQDGPQPQTDESGDTHYDYGYSRSQGGQTAQEDLDAILANVGEICRIAMSQVKDAAKQAKDAIKRRTTVEKDDGRVAVHFDAGPDMPPPPEPPEPPEPAEPAEPAEPPKGWQFEAELDSDAGRFYAGAGPKERKDVVYGFGYDKAKGGFYAQWGEWKGDSRTDHTGPHFSGEDSGMQPNDDGSYSVTALKDLRGLNVQTISGDVSIHVSEAPDAGVIIDGDVDELDVTCSADGVLTIREGRTASSSFFSRRGFCSADVELYIPRRHWETISITTASGDIDVDRDGLDIDQLTVSTASGDLSARLRACGQLNIKSASGDIDLEGECAQLHADTASGDISFRGQVGEARLHTASGDIELEGVTYQFRASSMSGDLRVSTSQLPEILELSTKSGDCEVQLPDAGPFMARMKSTSGEMHCDFPMNYTGGVFVYGDGTGPVYSMSSTTGDVSLERC